jgi:putative redox protein
MDAKVNWNGLMSFTGTANSGFTVLLDSDPEVGAVRSGFGPIELMAVSLSGCTAMDVISILRKKRQDVTAFEVRTHADQAGEHPHVFTHVLVSYIVTGHNVAPEAVERAIELSRTKYCPAMAMLSKAVQIDHEYKIIEASAEKI